MTFCTSFNEYSYSLPLLSVILLKKVLSLDKDFLSNCQVDPVFTYGFPKDKMDELQRAQIELNLKIGSRREIMERMGKQNIDELLKAIDDDTIEQAMVQVQVNQMVQGMGEQSPDDYENSGSQPDESTEEEPNV